MPVCLKPQCGGKRGGSGKQVGGGLMSEELGVVGGWTYVGEEAFRGVAICCFCCPVVETVASYSRAPSFEPEQVYQSVFEMERRGYRTL